MEFSSPPRNIDQLIKSRNAALKLKHGSPKLRDVLREKCKIRVKENRQKFVELFRSPQGSTDLKEVLKDTISEELIAFSSAVKRKENLFEITNDSFIDEELKVFEEHNSDLAQDFIDAEVELIMLSCDALLDENDFIKSLLENEYFDVVDCPICDMGNIVLTDSEISCTHCSIIIRAKTSLDALNSKIQFGTTSHSHSCQSKPNFVCKDNSLLMTCPQCSFNLNIVS